MQQGLRRPTLAQQAQAGVRAPVELGTPRKGSGASGWDADAEDTESDAPIQPRKSAPRRRVPKKKLAPIIKWDDMEALFADSCSEGDGGVDSDGGDAFAPLLDGDGRLMDAGVEEPEPVPTRKGPYQVRR